jgi:hypothetical protein
MMAVSVIRLFLRVAWSWVIRYRQPLRIVKRPFDLSRPLTNIHEWPRLVP